MLSAPAKVSLGPTVLWTPPPVMGDENDAGTALEWGLRRRQEELSHEQADASESNEEHRRRRVLGALGD